MVLRLERLSLLSETNCESAAVCSMSLLTSMSGNKALTSPSLIPLSIKDWIWVKRPRYSVSFPSSMPAVSLFISASAVAMPCWSLLEAARL